MVDTEIISCIQRYLRNVSEQNIAVSFGVLFGSHAVGRASKWSDIDLLVVGGMKFADIVAAISRPQEILRREINPVVLSLDEFTNRLSKRDPFLETVLKSPFIPIIGDLRELVRMAKKRLAH